MISNDVKQANGVRIFHPNLVNLYGCEIGENTKIGTFVEIQKKAFIGNNCKISSHSFICEGVTIEDNVFIGHGVMFTNDKFPRATNSDGGLQNESDWSVERTVVKKGASIGSNSTILSGITIGEGAMVGAGSVVTRDVPAYAVVYGNPAKEKLRVPFVDLKKQYLSIKPEIDKAIEKTIENSSFILGPQVEDFEKSFAQYCNVKYAIGVNSGTAALHLVLLALGIGPGDEVITVPNTFFATAEAISLVGATPVFVDVEKSSFNMDPLLVEQKITAKTRAIVPVDLFGNPANISELKIIAQKHNLLLVEDACQAHGAKHRGQRVGEIADAAVFSFYPAKNLGAYGEGGIVVTNNPVLAEKIKLLRAHGESPKNTHKVVGYNYRIEGIQGAVLGVKLRYLDSWNDKRRRHAALYDSLLRGIVDIPQVPLENESVYHLYVIRHPNRDALRAFLKKKNIDTGIHYQKPIHLQEAYSELGYRRGDLPVAERAMDEILSLPMFPEMSEQQIRYVCSSVQAFCSL
jgi:dTDP-4-amino-4,6-dideoxygalactose transaminase/acetyltransferase-like isoleucine patch superfamily enzyme